ncbi:uncharacterized protein EV420DRAFT_1550059 [Desarmillaria tabescens]|uniref:Uncharacterized protein n=1 Tax=Armillaria tabescens TaxID=1929756 RepID=A0AA39KAJ6_ARMTA|nr:uncharacterized protein EV420DRAFT_1550059 [Desarmillaria tabescens]KAK0457298.1 hypothetical protein EV420DRAFT_1550059 [Desarmillaria tabescens]
MISIYLCIDKRRSQVSVSDPRDDSRSSIWGTSESHADPFSFKPPPEDSTSPSSGSDSQLHAPGFSAIERSISHPPRNSEEISLSLRRQENGPVPYSSSESRPRGMHEITTDITYPLRALPSPTTNSQAYAYALGPEATEHSISSSSYIPEEMLPPRRIPRNRAVAHPPARNSLGGFYEFLTNLKESLPEDDSMVFTEHVVKLHDHIGYLKSQLELARALGYRSPLPSPGSGGENRFPDFNYSVPGSILAPSRRSSFFY